MSEVEQEQQVPTEEVETKQEEMEPVPMGEAVSPEDGPCLIRRRSSSTMCVLIVGCDVNNNMTFPPSRAIF
jgi:hypothetical protein